jgi:hypothetical protein
MNDRLNRLIALQHRLCLRGVTTVNAGDVKDNK